jgi:hypothetical protein
MSRSDYPAEVAAEIVEFLEYVESNPGGRWPDESSRLWQLYRRWRGLIRCAERPLLAENGTMRTLPDLSSYGRLFLMENSRKPAGGARSEADEAPPPTPPTPQWDGKTRTLHLGNKQLKKWTRRAPNQHSLLTAFEKAGWPQSIEAPLSGEQLKQTLRELREALKGTPLLFERAGQRCKVTWQVY